MRGNAEAAQRRSEKLAEINADVLSYAMLETLLQSTYPTTAREKLWAVIDSGVHENKWKDSKVKVFDMWFAIFCAR